MSAMPHPAPRARLLADADLCVKCGLCLPHCPTYLDTQHEGDSPRGRIALIQGLSNGLIGLSAVLEGRVDGCLSCRKCEVVCPARVPFSRVLDGGRAQLAALRPARTRLTRLLAFALVPRASRAVLRTLIGIYQGLGVQQVVRRFRLLGNGALARLESLLPAQLAAAAMSSAPTVVADAAPITLFRGCASDLLERPALRATEALLRAAGYSVETVSGQTCCGALHQHAGMRAEAQRLARRNIAAFAGHTRVASCTSGCAATLRDYADLDVEGGAQLAGRVQDFADWLLPQAQRLHFRPLPLRAALHLPCTASNVMKSGAALRALLKCVPGLEVIELDPAQHCCGAAGSHFIAHPDAADRLLQRKLDAIGALQPDLVLSANIGCTLHLAGGLSRARRDRAAVPPVPVRHPAELLAAQLLTRADWPPPRS